MQNILDIDGVHRAPVNADVYEFLEHLHKAYSAVLASVIGEKDDGGLLLVIPK